MDCSSRLSCAGIKCVLLPWCDLHWGSKVAVCCGILVSAILGCWVDTPAALVSIATSEVLCALCFEVRALDCTGPSTGTFPQVPFRVKQLS